MVHTEGNISTGRTPAREGQCNSGSRVEINEGSMQLDAEPSGIQSNPTPDGTPRYRLVCFPTDEAAITILQLEIKLRGTRDKCIPSGLVSDERICQSPWCLIARCSSQVKRQVAKVVMITPLWTSQPW